MAVAAPAVLTVPAPALALTHEERATLLDQLADDAINEEWVVMGQPVGRTKARVVAFDSEGYGVVDRAASTKGPGLYALINWTGMEQRLAAITGRPYTPDLYAAFVDYIAARRTWDGLENDTIDWRDGYPDPVTACDTARGEFEAAENTLLYGSQTRP